MIQNAMLRKDILLRLITCIVEVIERQLNEYLEGRLSNHYLFVIHGIVKSKINGTMAWLSYKGQTEQDTVIAFSIRQAQRAKLLCNQHK